MKKYVGLVIGFGFGLYLASIGHTIVTKEYWIIMAFNVAFMLAIRQERRIDMAKHKETESLQRQEALQRMYSYPPHTKYQGWAIDYVESETAIPLAWEADFHNELVDENWLYTDALKRAIKRFGINWE